MRLCCFLQVAFVKSVCALTYPAVMEGLKVLANNVDTHLSQMPQSRSSVANAVRLVRDFWDAALSGSTPGGAVWARLVQAAQDCPEEGEEYKDALKQLEEQLACLLGPPVPSVQAV